VWAKRNSVGYGRVVFGRRKDDEDPFAALKDGGTFQSTATTAADMGLGGDSIAQEQISTAPTPVPRAEVPKAAVPRATVPRATVGPTRSRQYVSGGGVLSRLAIVVMIVAIGAAISLVSSTSHSVHSITIPAFTTGTGGDNGFTTSTPSAPSTTSYLHSSSLRGALRRIAGIAPHSRLALLRLDARSLSTTAVLGGRRAKLIYFGPSGTFVTSSTPPSEQPIPISAIRPSAINRIVASMRSQFHVPASRIDYMVLTSLPGKGASWIIFAKTHGHPGYSATLSGTGLAPL
jgi:hypothetical protein